MRKNNILLIFALVLLLLYTLFLNFRIKSLKDEKTIEKEMISEQQKIIYNNILAAGKKIDNIEKLESHKYKIIYRFNDSCCFSCIQEGLILLESTMKENLVKELLIVGSNIYNSKINKYDKIVKQDKLSKLDKQNIPYIFFIDPNNRTIIFSLLLTPENYTINRKLINICYNALYN